MKYSEVYTPLLICCYAIIGFLAIYQLYLIQHHRSKCISWNSGFLFCCVPWCALRIAYWLMPADECDVDGSQMLQSVVLTLPINLEFVCFYLIMVYIMSKVREDADEPSFKLRVKWVSCATHLSYLASNMVCVVMMIRLGTRVPQAGSDDSDCLRSDPQKCHENGGCFQGNETASNIQQGLSALAFFLLALSLFFYGVKLHISPDRSIRPNTASMADPGESMPQLRWHAHESRYVTEGVCIALLLVFVSRAVFDALQLNTFAPAPITIPQDKDLTEFWIFFVYMAWEVFPCSLMLFFFGTIQAQHSASKPEHGLRDWRNFATPMTEGVDEQLVGAIEVDRPNPNWPLPPNVHEYAVSSSDRSAHGPLVPKPPMIGLMEDDGRYDSPSDNQPLHMPSLNTTSSGYYPGGGRADLYAKIHGNKM